MATGGGNAQKSAMARARNADKAGSKKGIDLSIPPDLSVAIV